MRGNTCSQEAPPVGTVSSHLLKGEETYVLLTCLLCARLKAKCLVNIVSLNFKVVSRVKGTQSCPTLCDPMDCSLPGSSVHGIFQTRLVEWVAISYFRDPHDRRLEPPSLVPLHFRQSPPLCRLGSPGLKWFGLIQIFTLDLDQADRKQNQT